MNTTSLSIIALLTLILFLLVYYVKRLKQQFSDINLYLRNIINNKAFSKTDYIDLRNPVFRTAKELEEVFRELNKKIEEKQKLLEKLFFSVPIPLVFFTNDGYVEFKNYAFKKGFADINSLDELKNIIRDEQFYKLSDNLISKNLKDPIDIVVNDKFYTINPDIIPFDDKKLYLFAFLDVTAIKKSQKIREEFSANVSHELKTPITVIRGFVETLESELPDDKLFMIRTIKKHIERLENLVSDILTLHTVESEKNILFQEFDLNEVVELSINLIQKDAALKNINVSFKSDERVNIIGDSFLITQILTNLLSNAIKFTPNNGKVNILISKLDNKVTLSCKDTGIGIPNQYLSKIFERFFVVDKSRARQLGGTGLGLSIVKHIVELHRGNIEVKSELGRGTEFIITLPVSQK